MNKRSMAVVCNGKEIAYGMNLLHLYKYIDEKSSFVNENAHFDVDMYSSEVFFRSNVPKDTVTVFIGDSKKADAPSEVLYRQWGITVWSSHAEFIVKADAKGVSGSAYIRFLEYANRKRREYLESEKAYVRKIEETDRKWIAGEFHGVPDGGLFGQAGSMKAKLRQQYDCAAFVLYLDYLRGEK